MADEIISADGKVTISADRQLVCLECAWELEALAKLLPEHVPYEDGVQNAHYAIRGISSRIKQLSAVLMNGLGDESVSTESMRQVVGCEI